MASVGVRRWPASIILWGSQPDCLRITPYIFGMPAQAIAEGIIAAQDEAFEALPRGRACTP